MCSNPLDCPNIPTRQVLTSYKFKVKMVPGPQKKGKAVRQVKW